MKLEEVFERLCLKSNDLESKALVYMFCKERITDLAKDIAHAYDVVESAIPDEVKNLMLWKLLCSININYDFLSCLNTNFDSDVTFVAEILCKDKDFLLDTITNFVVDFMKANDIELVNDYID